MSLEGGAAPVGQPDAGAPLAAAALLSGCGVKGGAVYGKSDADGKTVADGKTGAGDVNATIFAALGINPKKNYYLGSRPIPLTPEDSHPVKAILA